MKYYFRYVFKDSNLYRDHHNIEPSDDSEGMIDLTKLKRVSLFCERKLYILKEISSNFVFKA